MNSAAENTSDTESKPEYVTSMANPFARWLLRRFWVPVLLTILAEVAKNAAVYFQWAESEIHTPANFVFRFSFYPAFILGFIVSRRLLLEKTPNTFHRLVRNQVITEDQARELGDRLTRRMNGIFPQFIAIFFGLGIPGGIWMRQILDGSNWFFVIDPGMILVSYLITLIVWQGVQVGWAIYRLGSSADFKVRPLHPDRSGGLGCIGELCFTQSLGFTIIAVFCGAWLFLGTADFVKDVVKNYQAILLYGLFLAAMLSVLTFFCPLYSIHRAMAVQAKSINKKLQDIAHRLSLSRERVILEGTGMDETEFANACTQVTYLEALSNQERKAPSWPIPIATVIQFGSTVGPVVFALLRKLPELTDMMSR